ncbi:isopentenyl transferase family protein [Streptomyces sp. HPF1205]|uniref:isopentenyl transferase family protein n=1 Tax=Streptomyces sp. HPF1205 TaxID=2873262 RepID=UPI001CEDC65C|nr:isopentenyl transferase family protein [Streptomyces sp. HPF1205]
MHATRLTAADAAVAVTSNDRAVTDWCARYVRPWWEATDLPADQICNEPLVVAEVNPTKWADLAAAVSSAPHTTIEYARAPMLLARDSDDYAISGVSREEQLAYRSEPASGRLTIYGCDPEQVATAAARLAREAMRGVLLRAGWTVLHASAVVKKDRVALTFGSKGAGKTTTAVTLAARHGWQLLANDRVFVRPSLASGVCVLPWPSAAALGLGLLDALGWYDTVKARLEAGEVLHPTQKQRVTDALLSGQRAPLWEGKRELKAQIWPDQFPKWFNLGMAAGGQAATLLFPCIESGAEPASADGKRTLCADDFMSGATEDRYPDVFELARVDGGGTAEARQAVAERLATLPHHSVVLGHDVNANADFLNKLIENA